MSTTQHPRAQLSAYLDGALGEPDRLAVKGHLGSCADCRARLAELRATAKLIGSLPDPVPSRRLVPRVTARPAWLAPLRTLTTLASGLSVFLFLATALLANVGGLAGGSATTAAQPAAAPALGAATSAPSERGAVAPAATSASVGNADTAKQAATATPPSAAFSATQTPAGAAARTEVTRDHANDRAPGLSLTSPWVWLGFAIVTGLLALALQRRLRSA